MVKSFVKLFEEARPFLFFLLPVGTFVVVMTLPPSWCARVARNRWLLDEAQIVTTDPPVLFIHSHSEARWKETPLYRLTTVRLIDGEIIGDYIRKNQLSLLGVVDTELLVSEGGITTPWRSKGSREYALSLPSLSERYDMTALLRGHGDINHRIDGIYVDAATGLVRIRDTAGAIHQFDPDRNTLEQLPPHTRWPGRARSCEERERSHSAEPVVRTTVRPGAEGVTITRDTVPSSAPRGPRRAHFIRPCPCRDAPRPPRLVDDTLLLEGGYVCDNRVGEVLTLLDGSRIVAFQELTGESGKLILGRLRDTTSFVWQRHEAALFGKRGFDYHGRRIAWATRIDGMIAAVVVEGEGGRSLYAVLIDPSTGDTAWVTELH